MQKDVLRRNSTEKQTWTKKAGLCLGRKADSQKILHLESWVFLLFFFFDEWNYSFQWRAGSDKRTNDN